MTKSIRTTGYLGYAASVDGTTYQVTRDPIVVPDTVAAQLATVGQGISPPIATIVEPYPKATVSALAAAVESVLAVGTTNDTIMAAKVNDPDSAVRAALAAKLADLAASVGAGNVAAPRVSIGFDRSNALVATGGNDYLLLQAAAGLAAASTRGVMIELGPGIYGMNDVKLAAVPLTSYSILRGAGAATLLQNLTTYPSETDVDGWGLIRVPAGSRDVGIHHLAFRGIGAPDASHSDETGASVTLKGTDLVPVSGVQMSYLWLTDGMHGLDIRASEHVSIAHVVARNCQHPIYLYNSRRINVSDVHTYFAALTPATMLQRFLYINCSQDINIDGYHGENAYTAQFFIRTSSQYVAAGRARTQRIHLKGLNTRNDRATLPAGTSADIVTSVGNCPGIEIMCNVGTADELIEEITISDSTIVVDGGNAVAAAYNAADGLALDPAIPTRIRKITLDNCDIVALTDFANTAVVYFPTVAGLVAYAYEDITLKNCRIRSVCGSLFQSINRLSVRDCTFYTAGVRGDTLGRAVTIADVKDLEFVGNRLHSEDAPVALRIQGGVNGRVVGNTITKGSVLIDDSFRGENQYAAQASSRGVWAPSWGLAGIGVGRTMIANTTLASRFTVERKMSAALVAFSVITAAAADDTLDVSIHDAVTGAKLASSGPLTGRLNSTGNKTSTMTAPVDLYPDRAYYLAFTTGTFGGAGATLEAAGVGQSAAPVGGLMGTTMPYVVYGGQAAVGGTAPATLAAVQSNTYGSACPVGAIRAA